MLWKNYGKAMEFFSGDLYEPCKNDTELSPECGSVVMLYVTSQTLKMI